MRGRLPCAGPAHVGGGPPITALERPFECPLVAGCAGCWCWINKILNDNWESKWRDDLRKTLVCWRKNNNYKRFCKYFLDFLICLQRAWWSVNQAFWRKILLPRVSSRLLLTFLLWIISSLLKQKQCWTNVVWNVLQYPILVSNVSK